MAEPRAHPFARWTRHVITPALPGKRWGTGGVGLHDLTGDGRLEVVVSRRETQSAYWFRPRGDGSWARHTLGACPHLETTLGAAVLDLDGDGWPDVAFSGVWFRNPGCLASHPDTLWEARPYDGGGHDIIAADLTGNGRKDLITYDGATCAWFDPTRDMHKTVVVEGRKDHGGVAPHGVGDLNGSGLPDMVLAGAWYENPGRPGAAWTPHPWPHEPVPNASYGPSIRSWVADMNGSGWNDIVYSDCDTGWGHVYWVENRGRGEDWARHPLPDPPGDERTGSWHSLGVADFDGSGRLDIFAGEQEDASTSMAARGLLPMKPDGLQERGVIWVNAGGAQPPFEPVVIHQGWPGWHDAVLGDVSGDGRIDIVSKVWNTDWNSGQRGYHVDYWQNEIEQQ